MFVDFWGMGEEDTFYYEFAYYVHNDWFTYFSQSIGYSPQTNSSNSNVMQDISRTYYNE